MAGPLGHFQRAQLVGEGASPTGKASLCVAQQESPEGLMALG